jgi:hypothetical protein
MEAKFAGDSAPSLLLFGPVGGGKSGVTIAVDSMEPSLAVDRES